ncbi:MAG: hypothetical protein AB7G93_03935 [Bdellovibrionales bacterium]
MRRSTLIFLGFLMIGSSSNAEIREGHDYVVNKCAAYIVDDPARASANINLELTSGEVVVPVGGKFMLFQVKDVMAIQIVTMKTGYTGCATFKGTLLPSR